MIVARRRPTLFILPLLSCLLLLSGCQTYRTGSESRDQALRQGDLATALAQAERDAARHQNGKDAILYRLEQGAILRAAALAALPAPSTPPQPIPSPPDLPLPSPPANSRQTHLARSVVAFEDAARRIEAETSAARIRVGAESGALFTNQANVPYRGRAYDKVMLHTYQALNYLELAAPEAARVELNRALQSQRDAVAANAKRIAESRELARQAASGGVADEQGRVGQSYDVARAQSDPRTAAGLSAIERQLDASILPYGDYVNPFTTFLDALVFTHLATDASDLERGRKSWERVLNFAPDNPYIRTDYTEAEPDLQSASAAPPPPPQYGLTYVIFETGAAPYRAEDRIDIPLFLFTNNISYVGAALPRLVAVGDYSAPLTATTTLGRYASSLVASMDSVLAQDFKNEWPSILTRTLIATGTKATIDAVLQKQIEKEVGPTGALLFQLATAVTQIAINIADTRTWRSLPKQFHYARLPTPPDRRLTLSAGGLTTSVVVEPAAVTVVYVKSPGQFSPLLVSHFILKP